MRVLTLASVALLIFAACSSSDDKAQSTGSTAGAASGGAAGEGGGGGGSGASTGDGGSSTGGAASSGGTGGGGGSTTPEEACASYSQGYCTRLANCDPFVYQLLYADAAMCADRANLECLGTLSMPSVLATPDAVATCGADMAAMSCDDYFAQKTPASCHHAGALANGTACADSAQCASGLCTVNPATGCGTCETAPGQGEACLEYTCGAKQCSACAPGLSCGANVCKPLGALGEACSAAAPCATNLRCGAAGTCVALKPVGAVCDPLLQSWQCDFTSEVGCDSWTSVNYTCQPVKYADPGGSCWNGTVYKYCTAGSTCVFNAQATSGTCVAAAADGAVCNANQHCIAPATCVSGVCALPDASTCM